MSVTEYLAIYGAILSTIIGLASLYKWWTDAPKLKIDLKVNMIEKDGYIIKDHFNLPRSTKLMVISIANVGKCPTTLELLALQPYERTIPKRRSANALSYIIKTNNNKRTSAELPAVLNPGGIWKGTFSQDIEIIDLSTTYDLYLEAHHSHKKTPTKIKVNFNPMLTSVASYFDAEANISDTLDYVIYKTPQTIKYKRVK